MRALFVRSETISPGISTFWFKPDVPLRYTAGQFAELTLPHDKPDQRGTSRWFTLSSSPTEPLLAVTTKLAPTESSFKHSLESLQAGSAVSISQPMGDFVLPKDLSLPIVFIVAGIGVTPVRSIIKWLIDTGEQRSIHVMYGAHSQEEIAFTDLFKTYGAPHTLVLQSPPARWRGETGRLTADLVMRLSPQNPRAMFYLSGPESMVESIFNGLLARGLPTQRLVTDYFYGYPAQPQTNKP